MALSEREKFIVSYTFLLLHSFRDNPELKKKTLRLMKDYTSIKDEELEELENCVNLELDKVQLLLKELSS